MKVEEDFKRSSIIKSKYSGIVLKKVRNRSGLISSEFLKIKDEQLKKNTSYLYIG